jgi:hypothetical protein
MMAWVVSFLVCPAMLLLMTVIERRKETGMKPVTIHNLEIIS